VAAVENEISKVTLAVSNTIARTERLRGIRDTVNVEISAKNDIITKSESEIKRRNAIVERKQGIIDQSNKKLEAMIAAAGVSIRRDFLPAYFVGSELKGTDSVVVIRACGTLLLLLYLEQSMICY
jgi:hypothetical protein